MVCALALLPACQQDEQQAPPSEAIRAEDLPSLVLKPEDLPKAFTRFDHGEQRLADVPPGPREDPARFGRQGGWKARYSRQGSAETRGPLVIESRVDLFRTVEGAEQDLAAYRTEFQQSLRDVVGRGEFLADPNLGDDAVAATLLQGTGRTTVRFLYIAWRTSNATASLVVNGFEGKVTLEDALALARAQQEHIARIAER